MEIVRNRESSNKADFASQPFCWSSVAMLAQGSLLGMSALSDASRVELWSKIGRTLEASLAEVDVYWDAWSAACVKIHETITQVTQLGMGFITGFGSGVSGFASSTSDMDLNLATPEGADPKEMMDALASFLESRFYVTRIINHKAPVFKLFELVSGVEVDVCVNNQLGIHNTGLARSYAAYDPRARALGRAVKEWARSSGLVGAPDGMLSGYAWIMLVIYFLQCLEPCVLPNLQDEKILAEGGVPDCRLIDAASGKEYDARFEENTHEQTVDGLVARWPTQNEMSLGELTLRFFKFYAREFDWKRHMVCPARAKAGHRMPKSLGHFLDPAGNQVPVAEDAWVVQDPFKQSHNLSGNMSGFTRRRTHEALKAAYWLLEHFGDVSKLLPSPPLPQRLCFLRFSVRIAENDDGLAKQALQLFHWNDHEPMRFFRPVPRPTGRSRVDCYVLFKDWPSMRAAQSLNERSVTWLSKPIALFPSIAYDLLEALDTFWYVPGIRPTDEIVERNAAECRDLEGLGGHLLPYVQWYRAAPLSQKEPVQRPKPTANNVKGKAPPPFVTAQTPATQKPELPADVVPLPLRSGAANGADLATVLATRVPIPQIDEVAAAESVPVAIAAPKVPPTPPKPPLDFRSIRSMHAAMRSIAHAVASDIPPPPARPVPSRGAERTTQARPASTGTSSPPRTVDAILGELKNAGSADVKAGGGKAVAAAATAAAGAEAAASERWDVAVAVRLAAAAEAAAAEAAALGGPEEVPPPPAEAPPAMPPAVLAKAPPGMPAPKAPPPGLRGQKRHLQR